MVRAEIRFVFKPGARERAKIVRLTAPNRHNLHDLSEAQKAAVVELLERWRIFDPQDDVIE